MKTRCFLFVLFLLIATTESLLFAQNSKKDMDNRESFSALWKSVEQSEEASLPKSALEKADMIYRKALKEKNSPELLKAIIHKMKYELAIDHEKFPQLLKEVEQYTAGATDVTEQSVLYSMLANLYSQYYSSQHYLIAGRTALTGYVPDDIREWTENIFIQKITEYVNLSLKSEKELQAANALKYEAILSEGKSSRNLRPTLYDFLIHQGIDLYTNLSSSYLYEPGGFFKQTKFSSDAYFTPVNSFVQIPVEAEPCDLAPQTLKLYQQLLAFRLKDNNSFALLMTDLDRLRFVKDNCESATRDAAYLQALSLLEKQYEKEDFCAEVVYEKALHTYQSGQDTIIPFGEPEEYERTREEYTKKTCELCNEGIRCYPDYERIGLLKNLLRDLTASMLNVTSDNSVYPGKELELKITYKNIKSIRIEIYKITAPASEYQNIWENGGLYKTKGVPAGSHTVALPALEPYQQRDTVIKIPMNELGIYEYAAYPESNSEKLTEAANKQFSVSRLATVSRGYPDGREFLVVDKLSGKPVSGSSVNFYKRVKNVNQLVSSASTDANGLVKVPFEKDVAFYNVAFGDDKGLILSSTPWGSYFQPGNQIEIVSLFTDRAIYRPGQTVYFKGIASNWLNAGRQIPLNDKSYTVTFRDANGREVSQKSVKSNEFGSFHGEFIIPRNVSNGIFSIDAGSFSCNFRVEEYKRPTFDISFLPVKATYRFGDKVTVRGNVKTFSGVNLQHTKVKYRVVQHPHFFWRWYGGPPTQVAEGFAESDSEGRFEIAFDAEKSFTDKKLTNVFYTYKVEVSVTDTNGETQESFMSVSVGDKSMFLFVDLPKDLLDRENMPAIPVRAVNLNNEKFDCKGVYEIYSLYDNTILGAEIKPADRKKNKLIASGNFSSVESLNLQALKKEKPGRYRIVVKANDEQGREVTQEDDFILYSNKDKRPPVLAYEWIVQEKTACAPGESAVIYYGSSAKDVFVLYEILNDTVRIARSRFTLDNEVRKLEIPFEESYGKGITVILTFVKDGKLFSQNIQVNRKEPDKNLELKLDVFRDNLLPGQKEEWKLSVKDADKKPVMAEVLASMYDASLDKIYKEDWRFPEFTTSLWSPLNQIGNEFLQGYSYAALQNEHIPVNGFSYDSFNWYGMNVNNRVLMMRSKVGGLKAEPLAQESDAVLSELVVNASDQVEFSASWKQSSIKSDMAGSVPEAALPDEQPVQVRTDFNETAFFYPQLKTNETGETIISFTVPQSNTTWNFRALAHTKELKHGFLYAQAVSRKKLMITPNMPRFIRHGDKTTITTNISNLSEETQSGKVSIEFFDPNTEKTLFVPDGKEQSFSVDAGKTVAVSWTFDVPAGIDMTACKIVARSGNFSDGEQHLLPVLPNRMLVTEALPLNVLGNQTKHFSFDKLVNNTSQTAENYRLTLEFAGNPAWYAVQALPSIITPNNEDVISWFGAFYSNAIATSIANSSPKIKQIIDTWTKQGGTKETLLSNLEKNQELKSVLLEETPWVLEAKDETEQKQRLALLFDLNRSGNLSATAIEKLKELQSSEGGWTWFKGMYTNPSITQWILYGLGQLKQMNALDADNARIEEMQLNALAYIDNMFKKHFENLKKHNKGWQKTETISLYELEYLYVRSFYKNIPLTETDEAVRFYTRIVEKSWNKNRDLYSRAICAIIMKRSGKDAVASSIIKSLREHASGNEELGMYWANNSTNAFMFQSATCIHTFIMEAFEETGASSEMDKMKQWLLKQKQTQQWESVPATVNAIGVLLRTGSNWLESEGKATIQLGGNKINTQSAEAGTGYFKQAFDASVIKPEMGKITVSKQDAGPAWGALYWQYFENMDKITRSGTNLNVEKKLFVEKITPSGKTLEPVTAANPLKTGDKVVVRLTVRNDRDMEYVMLKDMRGACFEPAEQLSGNKWRERVVYYQTTKDASTNFYFYNLPKGTYVFEYPLYVARAGEYSNGITTIQCMYAPEFVSHTGGERVIVK